MVSLGLPGQTHINFRDSKLTRILQPSLSGNARMAIICCATPSELYLEETRSTLQFASRAKLVKTHAQVNQVIDERSLVKKLQRELRAAKKLLESQRTEFSTFEQLQKKCGELQGEIDKLTVENKTDQTRFDRLQNENNLLFNKIQAFETETFAKDRHIEDLNTKLQKISNENQKSQKRILELNTLFNEVKTGKTTVAAADVTHISETNINEFNGKVEIFETENEQLVITNRELKDLLRTTKRELQNIKTEKESIEFEYEEFKLSYNRETSSSNTEDYNNETNTSILEKLKADLKRSENKVASMREEMRGLIKKNKLLETQLVQSKMNKKSVGIQTNKERKDNFITRGYGLCSRIYLGFWHILGFFTRRRGYATELEADDSDNTDLEQKFI